MKKKILALVLSGTMVFSGSAAVFAADTTTDSTAEASLEAALGELLSGEGEGVDLEALVGSVTDENGELDIEGLLGSVTGSEDGSVDLSSLLGSISGSEDGSFDLSSLLGSIFGGEDGSFDLGELLGSLGISADSFDLEGLLGSLFDENGRVDLDGILGQFGVDASSLDIAGILDMIGGLGGERFSEELKSLEAEAGAEGDEVSLNDVEAMVNELISNPEEAKGLADSLFKEGGIAASLLDMLSGTSESLSGVVDSLKDSSGEYSLDRVVETLGTIEGNEEGVSIGGQELSQKEIEETVTQLLGAFGLSGEAAESNAAA